MKKTLSIILILVICISTCVTVICTKHISDMLKLSWQPQECVDSEGNKCEPQKPEPIDINKCGPNAEKCLLPLDYIFEDVQDSNKWYFEPIKDVWERGLMEGYGNGYFGVGDTLTWAQAVTLAVRVDEYLTENMKYEDMTNSEQWYLPYVNYAIKHNIIDEIVEDPNAKITRGETAKIFAKVIPKGKDFFSEEGGVSIPMIGEITPNDYIEKEIVELPEADITFEDVKGADEDTKMAIKELQYAGIVEGYSKDFFGVEEIFTREEAAAIISRLVKHAIDHNHFFD